MKNNSNELLNDWRPETTALLERLQKAGFEIVQGENCEEIERFESIPQMVKCLTACDEGQVYVKHADNDKRLWLYLVYGNSPGELICDYSVPVTTSVALLLNDVAEAHSNEWERKGQPKATREEIYGPKGGAK